jgi:DNA-binding MarR family transcriptional regulator
VTHAIDRLDDVVHQRVRLGLLTVLDELGEAEFNHLQKELGLTAGNLSRHITVLADANLVSVKKAFVEVRPRTWVAITKQGRAALAEEVAALRDLLQRYDATDRKP